MGADLSRAPAPYQRSRSLGQLNSSAEAPGAKCRQAAWLGARARTAADQGLRIEPATPVSASRLRNVLFEPLQDHFTDGRAGGLPVEQLCRFYSELVSPGSACAMVVTLRKNGTGQMKRLARGRLAAAPPAIGAVPHGRRVHLVHLPGAAQTRFWKPADHAYIRTGWR
jgi:hypothetical protein